MWSCICRFKCYQGNSGCFSSTIVPCLSYLILCFLAGMLKVIKQKSPIPVFVMIRPRGGDFLYTEEEFEVMKEDLKILKEAGADGVVFGILTRFVSVSCFIS